jgi:hypothetical protein
MVKYSIIILLIYFILLDLKYIIITEYLNYKKLKMKYYYTISKS